MRSFTSDNSFLKEAFALSLKPLNFASGLISRAEWIAVPQMFAADIPVGSSKKNLKFTHSLKLESKVLDTGLYIVSTKWDLPVPPLPERNTCFFIRKPFYFVWASIFLK